jgi:hypothetical protein
MSKRKPLFMGCTVKGSERQPLEYQSPEGHGHPGMSIESISIVPAPECEVCASPMEPASSTEWACVESGCPQFKLPVETGIYPIRPARSV